MARKKVAGPRVHLLDRTIGNELNIEDLMCGSTVGGLEADDIVVDPTDTGMPEICNAAEAEGRMCPGCKRCVAYYAKGIYLGGMRERQTRAPGALSTRDN